MRCVNFVCRKVLIQVCGIFPWLRACVVWVCSGSCMLCVVRVCLQGCARYVNPRHCTCSCSGERAVAIFHSGWGMCVCVHSDCVGNMSTVCLSGSQV